MNKSPLRLLVLPLFLCAALLTGQNTAPDPANTAKWEKDWKAFETLPAPPPGTIAVIGSSSMRKWKSIAQDLAPLPVWNRAFGGSKTADLLPALPRLLLPHRPKVIIYYCGDNDLVSATSQPEVPVENFKRFVAALRKDLPKTRIVYLNIKPSGQRAAAWPLAQQANAAIAAWCANDPLIYCVDTAKPLLGTDGKPDPTAFLKDNLHLNAEGYRRWTALIKPVLEKAWATAQQDG